VRRFLLPLGLLCAVVAAIVVGALEPWKSHEREHELEWIEAFAAWSDRIDTAYFDANDAVASKCASAFSAEVGEAPKRLRRAKQLALEGCAALRRSIDSGDLDDADDWYALRDDVIADLSDRRAAVAAPTRSAELEAAARPYAGRDPIVLCWSDKQWDELSEEWALISVDELWPIGFADPNTGQIHLAPEICGPLGRFFGGNYAPHLNEESLDLAIALVTLAHEAEHLRSPEASEADVECVAMQRVRDLVQTEGRSESYIKLMGGLALDVAYPNNPPKYRTKRCHDGGALDIRPETTVWP
jgi:hypothetical protein